MQGSEMHLLIQKGKKKSIDKKFKLWKTNLDKSKLDSFALLNICAQDDTEASNNLFVEYWDALSSHF